MHNLEHFFSPLVRLALPSVWRPSLPLSRSKNFTTVLLPCLLLPSLVFLKNCSHQNMALPLTLGIGITDEYLIATSTPPHLVIHPPNPRMPAAEFATLSFPPLQKIEMPAYNADMSPYFSSDSPDSLPINLLSIPVPPFASRLQEESLVQWNLGARSIIHSIQGVVRRLPLWLPAIWVPIIRAVRARPEWMTSLAWHEAHILSGGPVPPSFLISRMPSLHSSPLLAGMCRSVPPPEP